MNIHFTKLTHPTPEAALAFTKWENDPALVYLMRPNGSREELERNSLVTVDELNRRIQHDHIYLIHFDGRLIGEMDYQIDPQHLYKKDAQTAWIGINIGEETGRGKGIGVLAMQYLEDRIKEQGISRLELGVFEFNLPAQKLYRKLGYQEIGRVPNFTFWQDKMWTDVRMEKYI